MKAIIYIIVFTLRIAIIYCDITSDMQSIYETCCETAYGGDPNLKVKCPIALREQFDGTVTLFLYIENSLDDAEYSSATDDLMKLIMEENDETEYYELSERERIKIAVKFLLLNTEDIIREGNIGRDEEIDKYIDQTKIDCKIVKDLITNGNEPKMNTLESFAFIVAAGFNKYKNEEQWKKFFTFLKNNNDIREDLINLHAQMWQVLQYTNENVIDFINTCGCEKELINDDFLRYLAWVYQQKIFNEKFKICDLKKQLDIFNAFKEKIFEDNGGNKDKDMNEELQKEIKEAMKGC